MSCDQASEPTRTIEHFEVRVPSPIEVANMRDYPAAVMQAVALAANEAGLDGKRLDGFALVPDVSGGTASPRIVLQVSKEQAAAAVAFGAAVVMSRRIIDLERARTGGISPAVPIPRGPGSDEQLRMEGWCLKCGGSAAYCGCVS